MKDWFDNLEARERLFVGIGGTVAVLVILWGLIWVPLDRGHKAAQDNVVMWQQAVADIRRLRAMAEAGGASPTSAPAVGSNQTPIVIVDQTLSTRGLNNTLKRRQPTPNGIRVEFEDVAFDDLVLWLGELSNRYALDVQAGNLSVSSRAERGRINASLTLERTL